MATAEAAITRLRGIPDIETIARCPAAHFIDQRRPIAGVRCIVDKPDRHSLQMPRRCRVLRGALQALHSTRQQRKWAVVEHNGYSEITVGIGGEIHRADGNRWLTGRNTVVV